MSQSLNTIVKPIKASLISTIKSLSVGETMYVEVPTDESYHPTLLLERNNHFNGDGKYLVEVDGQAYAVRVVLLDASSFVLVSIQDYKKTVTVEKTAVEFLGSLL